MRDAAQRLDEGHRARDQVGIAADLEVLGPQAQRDLVAGLGARGVHVGADGRTVAQPQHRVIGRGADELGLDEVHLRAADEAGDEEVVRMLVQLQRRADLLDLPGAQHHDAVGQRHRLDLVVGDVDHRRLQVLMQLRELIAHPHAQRGVEVGQRLVEQEHLGLAHDRAADGHALALPARQVLGLALEQVLDVQDARGVAHRAVDLVLRYLGQLQPERHVVVQVHVGVERVALEHHRDAALGRRHVVDQAAADAHLAAGDVLQPGDRAQQRRLAAARRADEDHEFAVPDLQVDAMQDLGLAIGLDHAVQLHVRHLDTSARARGGRRLSRSLVSIDRPSPRPRSGEGANDVCREYTWLIDDPQRGYTRAFSVESR